MLIEGKALLNGISTTPPASSQTTQPAPAVTTISRQLLAGPPLPPSIINRNLDGISHFHDWQILGDTQSQLSSAQASELATLQIYRQLGSLQQALGKTSSELLANQLKQWESQLLAQGSLDNQLQPGVLQKNGIQQHYLLEKIDLLVTRPKDEQIAFFFRDTRSTVSTTLPAQAGKAELLLRLQTTLAREGIQVRLNAQNQLEFAIARADRQKLDRPVLLSGDGYRIPAGNPVAIRLQPVDGVLTQLATQLLSLNATQFSTFSQELERLRKRLKFNISTLRKHRQQLLHELEDHPFDFDSAELESELLAAQFAVRDLLQSEHYRTTSNNLAAQANLTRKNVIALLFDE